MEYRDDLLMKLRVDSDLIRGSRDLPQFRLFESHLFDQGDHHLGPQCKQLLTNWFKTYNKKLHMFCSYNVRADFLDAHEHDADIPRDAHDAMTLRTVLEREALINEAQQVSACMPNVAENFADPTKLRQLLLLDQLQADAAPNTIRQIYRQRMLGPQQHAGGQRRRRQRRLH